MNSKGISAVISTVLILALVMVVTVIVWVTISNVVRNQSQEISLGKVEISLNILKVYAEGNNLIVNVERGKGKGDLTGIKFIIDSSDKEEIISKEVNLREFDSDKFSLTLTKFDPLDVVKVSVAPVLSSGSADIKDVWELGKSGINCVPIPCPDPSTLCTTTTLTDGCGTSCVGTKSPFCPDAFTIQCGVEISSTNECSGCTGKGTQCGELLECLNDVCVKKLRIFTTSGTGFNGALGGINGADGKCMQEASSKGYSGNWKALIGASNRYAYPVLTNWVLQNNTKYYRIDGVTLIDETGINSWFTFTSTLNNSISTASTYQWTGLNPTNGGLINSAYTCNDWNFPFGSVSSYAGYANIKAISSIVARVNYCNIPNQLYCVEQP